MDQRRPVDEFHGDRRAEEAVGVGRRSPGGQKHKQRSQPLAPGGDGLAAVTGQELAVRAHQLGHAPFGPLEQAEDLLAAEVDHRLNRCRAHPFDTTPTWSAMMPPAVIR